MITVLLRAHLETWNYCFPALCPSYYILNQDMLCELDLLQSAEEGHLLSLVHPGPANPCHGTSRNMIYHSYWHTKWLVLKIIIIWCLALVSVYAISAAVHSAWGSSSWKLCCYGNCSPNIPQHIFCHTLYNNYVYQTSDSTRNN
jgi:hypothetical protein